MMERYLVIHEYTCPTCNGEGMYYNERWTEANDAHDAAYEQARASISLPTTATEDEYYAALSAASNAGWQAITDYWDVAGFGCTKNRWPPEELQCIECEGTGTIREETDLAAAIQALKFGTLAI